MQAYQLSHWEWNSFFKNIDILIVGSGIVGLSAAIHLKEQAPKLKVVVVERGPLPIGASTRNAGFACFGSLSELEDDLAHNSREAVLQLVQNRYRGLQKLRQRYGDEAIGYEALGGYELFRSEDQDTFDACKTQLERWNKDLEKILGIPKVYRLANSELPDKGFRGVQHLIHNQAEGQLNTGKLMRTLLKRAQSLNIDCLGGITINNLQVLSSGIELQTSLGWSLRAPSVLVATNGFARQLLPELAVTPARNQVLITAPLPDLPFRGSYHYDRGYVYFRNVGQRVLLGGGRNLNPQGESTTSLKQTEQIQIYLQQLLREVILPGCTFTIERWWSGIMGVGEVKTPIVREVKPGLVVAVRLGGMGVALGTSVGEAAAGLLHP